MAQQKEASMRDEGPRQQSVPVCPYCNRRLRDLDDLTLHIVTRHTGKGHTSATATSAK